MFSYLAFLHSGIETYTGRAIEDGKHLARNCIEQLRELDPDQFPPRLLMLHTSPAYLDISKARNLLNGVNQAFAAAGYQDIPLVGCSAATVFFGQRVHPDGALLICLASRLLRAEVAVGANAINEPEKAVNDLLKKLELHADEGEDPNPFANRTLFTFFPGFDNKSYPASSLHRPLRENLRARIPIFGGVASADDPERMRSGILFADKEVHRNAVVAARVMCGTPLGANLSHGLTITDRLLRVSNFSKDKKLIYSFHEGKAAEVMRQEQNRSPVVLLAEVSINRHPVIDTPKLTDDGLAVHMIRSIGEDTCYRVMRPVPEKIQKEVREGVKHAGARARVENPTACLAFKCNGLLRNRQKIALDFEQEFAAVENDLNLHLHPTGIPRNYVGAFLDGEAGVDREGRSLLRNWSTAAMVFGDELSARTPVYRGFAKLADLAREPLAKPEEAIRRLLQLIYEIGFPGAMISSWLPDQEQEAIVAKDAIGSRYKKVLELACASIESDNVLVRVAKDKRPMFIPDWRKVSSDCDQQIANRSGVISQYIIPLMNLEGRVNHVLQIDLGDARYKKELHQIEREAFDAIGTIISSILNRVFSGQESRIILDLDRAMKECLSAETIYEGLQKYLELALKTFGLEMGQIRRAEEDKHTLTLVAGAGRQYNAVKKGRRGIDFGDVSPAARAFREETVVIINDAPHNKAHQAIYERLKNDREQRELYEEMKAIGSYANIYFESESRERGAISLLTSAPWFFNWFHIGALNALGERIGFLIDNLLWKQSRKFFLSVNPQLSEIQNLNDYSRVLAKAIKRFASDMNADFASLFLWDEDRELYILRAQYRWHDPDWVNAAHYRKDDVWTGSTALAGLPRYIPDLHEYYQGQQYSVGGHYNRQIFGQELSKKFTVEAIGLPLRVGNEQIGIMMLYRQIKDSQQSGFLTTNGRLLLEGADSLAGLVNALESNRQAQWEKEELRRHQKIYEACSTKDDSESFETRVCRQVTESYHAISADFYSVKSSDPVPQIVWKGGFRSDSKTDKTVRPPSSPDDLVNRAALINQKSDKEPLALRHKLSAEELEKPLLAKAQRSIKRVCVPLVGEKQLVGLLDLNWSPSQSNYRYSKLHLQLLGEIIGAAYWQHQISESQKQTERMKREAESLQRQNEMMRGEIDEQSELAVKATGAYVFQSLHRLANVIQGIKSLPVIIKATTDEEERVNGFRRLEKAVREATLILDSVKDVGERVAYPRKENYSLADLIKQALRELQIDKSVVVDVDWAAIEKLIVKVDPKQTKQVFINLIRNAVEATEGRERRKLTIIRSAIDTDSVIISLKDTGKGMTDEEIRAAMRGFVSTRGHKGVGVLISRVLLYAQGGTLKYRSTPDDGTETLITLPITDTEVAL